MWLNPTNKVNILLPLLSGLLLSLGWPETGDLTPLLFFGLVPLLLLEDQISASEWKFKKLKLFFLSFIGFAIWNTWTTWWIYNAAFIGAFMAVLLNSTYMGLIMLIYHLFRKKFSLILSLIFFIVLFISYEHIHYYWDLTWPWLTLGNGFANSIHFIQWYEFTGVFGGSLWILGVNSVIFYHLKNGSFKKNEKFNLKSPSLLISALILIPTIVSLILFYSYREEKRPVNITVVQPNMDPYNEKFDSFNTGMFLELSKAKINDSTDYLLFPETALSEYLWENDLNNSEELTGLKNFLKEYPKLNIVTGLSSRKIYYPNDKRSLTARKFPHQGEELYYDSYNTAIQIGHSDNYQIYHKSKLVPGVENLPFAPLFKHIESFTIDLGGITGSLGIQDNRGVFSSENGKYKIAPVICYESVFGEYVSEYIKNGANFIFILTNDGWWDETPGYLQHLAYGRLRAIENRRSIARSANTGISCFINQRGEIDQPQKWWTRSAISGKLNSNDMITFYCRFGDLIAYFSMGILGLMTIWYLGKRIIKPKK